MTINEAFQDLYENLKGLTSNQYYDGPGFSPRAELITPKNKKLDSMGNELVPGDMVAYSLSSATSSCQLGILLGWTPEGYRVVGFRTHLSNPEYRTLASHTDKPYQCFLVKRK